MKIFFSFNPRYKFTTNKNACPYGVGRLLSSRNKSLLSLHLHVTGQDSFFEV